MTDTNQSQNNENQVPIGKNNKLMKSFRVMMRMGKNDVLQKAIFIDEEMLDWAVDASSLMEAKKMGQVFFKAIQRDIEQHFIESVSEVVGRKVTPQEIKDAIASGWI